MEILTKLQPERVFHYFELFSSVPHGSGNTAAVAKLCADEAERLGLKVIVEPVGNVIIYKPASKGYENHASVILQGHLDMVCAKPEDSDLDMNTTPVKLLTDGEWVYADGTSLGGDDMIAAACAFAVLEDDTLAHPPIEVLLTNDEETGLCGAMGVNPDLLKGRKLINLDSEEEGVFTVGCAGGLTLVNSLPLRRESGSPSAIGCKLTVSGLLGGHSGEDIDKERASSHALMGRLLYEASKDVKLHICRLEGGQFENVIPGKTVCELAVEGFDYAKLCAAVERIASEIKNELASCDPGVTVELTRDVIEMKPICNEDTERIIKLLLILPQGLQNMSMEIKGLPQTSLNTGIVRATDTEFEFVTFIRSSIESQKLYLGEKVRAIVALLGGTSKEAGCYCGWAIAPVSELRDVCMEAFCELNGRSAAIRGTHGGLECGLLMGKLPGLDCISMGPALYDVHSIREKMNVASVAGLYELLIRVLAKL